MKDWDIDLACMSKYPSSGRSLATSRLSRDCTLFNQACGSYIDETQIRTGAANSAYLGRQTSGDSSLRSERPGGLVRIAALISSWEGFSSVIVSYIPFSEHGLMVSAIHPIRRWIRTYPSTVHTSMCSHSEVLSPKRPGTPATTQSLTVLTGSWLPITSFPCT